MPSLIESLESRTLFSGSPAAVVADLSALKSDLHTSQAELVAFGKLASKATGKLTADLRTSRTADNRALLATLRLDTKSCVNILRHDLSKLKAAGNADVHQIIAADKLLLRNPSDAAAQARLTAGVAKLEADRAASTLGADLVTCRTTETTDLTNLVAANSTNTALQSDVATDQSGLTSGAAALQSAISTLNANITTFINDASAF